MTMRRTLRAAVQNDTAASSGRSQKSDPGRSLRRRSGHRRPRGWRAASSSAGVSGNRTTIRLPSTRTASGCEMWISASVQCTRVRVHRPLHLILQIHFSISYTVRIYSPTMPSTPVPFGERQVGRSLASATTSLLSSNRAVGLAVEQADGRITRRDGCSAALRVRLRRSA
jgi:hypothetical protein